MSWFHDGETWKSGWFLDEDSHRTTWDDRDFLLFSADGITDRAIGTEGITIAANYAESKENAWLDIQQRPLGVGDDITFDLNSDAALLRGLPPHPITGEEALEQSLDKSINGIEWEGSILDDVFTINANSIKSSIKKIYLSTLAGNDIIYLNGYLGLLTGCSNNSGLDVWGGAGNDTLILPGSFDDYNISLTYSRDGFEIQPLGSTCSSIYTGEIELIQGEDFSWTFGDRFPVMGEATSKSGHKDDRHQDSNSAVESGGPGATTIINNYINNNTSSVSNNTNNVTTTNISNSGSGNITVGNIGTVNNTTTIDNSFTIQTTNINLSLAITGDSKKSEKVEGTDGDDLIADGRGKDKLIGGDGADQFYFSGEEPFKKKTVDKVIDFDSSEGDAIVIADEVVGDLTEDPTLAIADTKKELKQLSKDGYDLLYFEPKGDLYVDGNGDSKGFGKKSEGGMIADLPNDTILTESDVLIGV